MSPHKQNDTPAVSRRGVDESGCDRLLVGALTLDGITTDASQLYPVPITEVFGEISHQICKFHTIAELTKAVLRAVARVRKSLAASLAKRRRGRPSKAERKTAQRGKRIQ